MDYSQLSDFEINKRVAEIVYSIEVVADDFYAKDVPFAYHRDEQIFIFIDEPLSGAWRSYNPCNSPADAWPIIADNHIGIAPYPNEAFAWSSRHGMASDLSTEDKNPLRAAMVVFLMMKDEHYA